jgi:hypothetical protein
MEENPQDTETIEWTPDNLWVVAENQLGGWCACDSLDGHLMTYATQAEAQAVAEGVIEELNDADISHHGEPTYAPDSWAGVLLAEASIGDEQNHIIMPLAIESFVLDGRRFPSAIGIGDIEAWKQRFPDRSQIARSLEYIQWLEFEHKIMFDHLQDTLGAKETAELLEREELLNED